MNSGDVLQISFIGYVTQEIKYTGQATLTVNLMEDTQKLEEVVVVGYGTQKKVNMTGAVAQIDSKALENRPVQNVSTALQGTMPGVQVTSGGGRPGQDGGTTVSYTHLDVYKRQVSYLGSPNWKRYIDESLHIPDCLGSRFPYAIKIRS